MPTLTEDRNVLDPVTPLVNAEATNNRLGNNARLVKQLGMGHTTLAQFSFCTALIAQAYWLDGTVPSAKRTDCTVDEEPFVPLNLTAVGMQLQRRGGSWESIELSEAWAELVDRWSMWMHRLGRW
jgi:hypothetical protein